jgi:hypothetical protein
MDKNALEQLLSSYNWWMGISTVAVAVGILGEYVAHFVFEKEARRNRLEMGISILFGILVLGGVVGEYEFGKRLSQASEQLQRMADAEVAQANKDAAQARKDAEVVRQQSADTNERAAKTEKETVGLEQDVATAKTEMARQQIRAAEAERSLLALQEKLQDRHLSLEQKKAIRNALKGFPPQEVNILAVIGTSDGTTFGIELADAINSAGWKATFSGTEASGGNVRGLALVMRDTHHPPLGARQLQDALKAAGLSAPAWNAPQWGGSESAISLLVAPREM